jgi:hypothetical protein
LRPLGGRVALHSERLPCSFLFCMLCSTNYPRRSLPSAIFVRCEAVPICPVADGTGPCRHRQKDTAIEARPEGTTRCGLVLPDGGDQRAEAVTSLRHITWGLRQSDIEREIVSDQTLNAQGEFSINETSSIKEGVGKGSRVSNGSSLRPPDKLSQAVDEHLPDESGKVLWPC